MAAQRKRAIRPCRLRDCRHRHCPGCTEPNCRHTSRWLPEGKYYGTANKLYCCQGHAKLAHWRRNQEEVNHANGNQAAALA